MLPENLTFCQKSRLAVSGSIERWAVFSLRALRLSRRRMPFHRMRAFGTVSVQTGRPQPIQTYPSPAFAYDGQSSIGSSSTVGFGWRATRVLSQAVAQAFPWIGLAVLVGSRVFFVLVVCSLAA